MLLNNKIKIEEWLNKYRIKNYELIEDKEYGYVVNVKGNVNLYDLNLKSIDIKFNEVNGYFNCSNNNLKSLEGIPKMVKGNFSCSQNELTSLVGGPSFVGGFYYCSDNKLRSLIGICEKIEKDFYCNYSKLESLIEFPKIINGSVYLNGNKININELKDLLIEKSKNKIFIGGTIISLKNNPELGELQKITNINELKKILTIYQEKADLMKVLEVRDQSVKNLDLLINNNLNIINKSIENTDIINMIEVTNKSIIIEKINKI